MSLEKKPVEGFRTFRVIGEHNLFVVVHKSTEHDQPVEYIFFFAMSLTGFSTPNIYSAKASTRALVRETVFQ